MSVMTLPVPTSVGETKGRMRLRKTLRIGGTSVERASFDMLRLYRTNLEVRLCCVDEISLQSECQKHTYSAVRDMLKTAGSSGSQDRELEWNEIHKAERLIALLLSGAQLRHEIRARLQDLAAQKVCDADRLCAEFEALQKPGDEGAPASDDNVFRAFLLRVMELLHRTEKEKYLARPIRSKATKNLLMLLIVGFLFMVAPYLLLAVDFHSSNDLSAGWTHFALYTALVSGLFGALFSRLLSLQRNGPTMSLEEIFLHREFSYTLLRAGFGMCAAFIVYFLLRAGVVDSALFPKFDKVAIEFVQIAPPAAAMSFGVPSKDLALLTIWSFLAGFSEMFVPNLLANTEQQMAHAKAQAAAK